MKNSNNVTKEWLLEKGFVIVQTLSFLKIDQNFCLLKYEIDNERRLRILINNSQPTDLLLCENLKKEFNNIRIHSTKKNGSLTEEKVQYVLDFLKKSENENDFEIVNNDYLLEEGFEEDEDFSFLMHYHINRNLSLVFCNLGKTNQTLSLCEKHEGIEEEEEEEVEPTEELLIFHDPQKDGYLTKDKLKNLLNFFRASDYSLPDGENFYIDTNLLKVNTLKSAMKMFQIKEDDLVDLEYLKEKGLEVNESGVYQLLDFSNDRSIGIHFDKDDLNTAQDCRDKSGGDCLRQRSGYSKPGFIWCNGKTIA